MTPTAILLKRCIADVFLFAAVVIVPWWLVFPVALFLVFYFERYYEALLAAFIFDLLYGIPLRMLFGFPFLATFVFILFFYAAENIKPNVRLRR